MIRNKINYQSNPDQYEDSLITEGLDPYEELIKLNLFPKQKDTSRE